MYECGCVRCTLQFLYHVHAGAGQNVRTLKVCWELNNPANIFPYVALAAAAACKTSQCCHHINCAEKA